MNSKAKNTSNRFKELLKPKDHQEKLELDALMLAAPYLEIIQNKMEESGIKKKDLAEALGTSASYVTQLMNTNKMMNFSILARIAEVLDLKFQVTKEDESLDVEYLEKIIQNKNLIENTFVQRRFMAIWAETDKTARKSFYSIPEIDNMAS